MAIIKSGASGSVLTIDPTTLAARVILYDPTTNLPITQAPTGAYFLDSYARLGIMTAGATVALFSLRNGVSRIMRIRGIRLQVGFTGTAAATESVFTIKRFFTATPSGGASLTPSRKTTGWGNSIALDARDIRGTDNATTGLTTTSLTFESPSILTIVCPHQNGGFGAGHKMGNPNTKSYDDLQLQVNEGICICLEAGNSIAGVFYSATIEWEEY